MRKRRLGLRERKTSKMWLRNTSKFYSNEEIWPLLKTAWEATERNLAAGEKMPDRLIIDFTNCSYMWRGRAFYALEKEYDPKTTHPAEAIRWYRILCRVGNPGSFSKPVEWTYWKFKDMPVITFNGHREAIVTLAAHEMQHIVQHVRGSMSGRKRREEECEMNAWDALDYYRKHRAEIDAEIDSAQQRVETRLQEAAHRSQEAKDPNVRLTKQFEKATRRLEQWKRRMKAATNKVKKYQRAYNRLAKKIGASV